MTRSHTKPTPAPTEATARAEARRVANLAETPARARRFLLALADGEYACGTNRPEPQPTAAAREERTAQH